MSSRSVARFYVQRLGRVLHGAPRLLSFLACVRVACHRPCARGARRRGRCAFADPTGSVRRAPVSLRPLESSGLPGSADFTADRALLLSLVGLGVVFVKGAAGAYATFVQARVAGEVGSDLRLELLDALLAVHRLHRPRQDDHGVRCRWRTAQAVVALTDRVRDVEAGLEQGLLGGARAAAQLAPIAALLFVLSGRMALAAALVLGAFGALARPGSSRVSTRDAARRPGARAAARGR